MITKKIMKNCVFTYVTCIVIFIGCEKKSTMNSPKRIGKVNHYPFKRPIWYGYFGNNWYGKITWKHEYSLGNMSFNWVSWLIASWATALVAEKCCEEGQGSMMKLCSNHVTWLMSPSFEWCYQVNIGVSKLCFQVNFYRSKLVGG